MKLGSFIIWMTDAEAKAERLPYRARFLGVIPGYYEPECDRWAAKGDWLVPLEIAAAVTWRLSRRMAGKSPEYFFDLQERITELEGRK